MPNPIPSNLRAQTERHATRVALAVYDQSEAAQIFPLIAAVPRRPPIVLDGQAKWYALEGLVKWREFIDRRVINYLRENSYWVEVKPYEYTEALEAQDENWGQALYQPIERAPEIMAGWQRKVLALCFAVFESNATASIDNKAFFHATHEHLFDRSVTYSNIVDDAPGRVDQDAPTADEVRVEFQVATERLRANRIRGRELRRVVTDSQRYVVIVRDAPTARAYRELLTEPTLVRGGAAVQNTYQGGFELIEIEPPAGGPTTGLDYYVVRADPGGPRPVVWLPWRNPQGIQFRMRDEFDRPLEEIVYGMFGSGGTGVAFPQCAVTVQAQVVAPIAGPMLAGETGEAGAPKETKTKGKKG